MKMTEPRVVTATLITRPARRLVIRRGIAAGDYFAYCEEIGCAIWDTLAALPGRLDSVAFVRLPPALAEAGKSLAGCAAEVPLDWDGALPDGCSLIALPAHEMLWFQGAPYEEESWYGHAHAEMPAAIAHYCPERYGIRFAYDEAPEFHYGTTARTGCRQLVPVARLGEGMAAVL